MFALLMQKIFFLRCKIHNIIFCKQIVVNHFCASNDVVGSGIAILWRAILTELGGQKFVTLILERTIVKSSIIISIPLC